MSPANESPSHPVFAAVYDPVTQSADEALLHEHREYLVRDLEGTVLDLGAGTGAMFPFFEAAAIGDRPLDVHAVEPDPHMRKRAVSKASDLDVDIELRPDGAASLSYADDSFDVVIASLVFCTIPDVDAALEEVARVLKPDGEFRFLEHVQADGWAARVQDAVNPVWRLGAAGCNLNRDTAHTFRTNEHFEVVEIEDLAVGVPSVMPFVRGSLVLDSGS